MVADVRPLAACRCIRLLTLINVGFLQIKGGHRVELLQSGQAFFPSLVQAIDICTQEVRLETYIFHFDTSGEQVASALVRAALRGASVYVVMDGIGTPDIPAPWVEQFAQSGVRWHRFSPLGSLGYLIPMRWRRLHRKLCVVDGHTLFCGGINILNDFEDPNHGKQEAPRFDFAVRVQGPLVQDAHRLMQQFWARLQLARELRQLHIADARQTLQAAKKPAVQPHPTPASSGAQQMHAGLVLRDNFLHRRRIERAYRKAIGEAQTEVLIANAYFLPGRKIRKALIHAARRGVRIRLLLHGRYEYFMQYHASRPVYGALLAAGVEIYEYSSGFLHAKVAVVDQRWATVGSSNLDPLSLLLAREANIVVQSHGFASALRNCLQTAIETQSVAIEQNAFSKRPWTSKILDIIAYSLMRLSLLLTGRRY